MTLPKPVPQPTAASQPYWDACRNQELRIQRCTECGTLIHYPKLRCPKDGNDSFDWVQMSGAGKVYSYVIAHRAFHPAFADEVPYIIAIIDLDEGVRILSNLIGIAPEAVSIGMRVTLAWGDRADDYPVPLFRPVEGGAA